MILQCKSSSINQLDIKLGVKHIFEILYLKSFCLCVHIKIQLIWRIYSCEKEKFKHNKKYICDSNNSIFLGIEIFQMYPKKVAKQDFRERFEKCLKGLFCNGQNNILSCCTHILEWKENCFYKTIENCFLIANICG